MKKLSLIILILILLFVFSACTPKTMEKAKNKMEKKGYTVEAYLISEDGINYLNSDSKNGFVKIVIPMTEKVDGRLQAYKDPNDSHSDGLVALYFDNEIKAINFYNEYQNEYNIDNDYEFVRSGKWVISGTSQAIKDFTS